MKKKINIEDKLLLTPKDFQPTFPDWMVKGVLNPAAVRMPDGRIMLYVRISEASRRHEKQASTVPVMISGEEFHKIEELVQNKDILRKRGHFMHLKNGKFRLTTISHFRRAVLSPNGFDLEYVEHGPAFTGQTGDGGYGVEDPRIVKIGNRYAMTYVIVNKEEGVCTSLATSRDLKNWKRHGIIFRQQNKDALLFPEKIKGKYVALHRPEGTFEFSKASIWISHSPDLIHWGEEKSIISPREKSWDSWRIGTGAPPIKVKGGWLLIYHGVEQKGNKNIYRAGAALLKGSDPSVVLARSPRNEFLFEPTHDYEKTGFVNNVVFPSAAIVDRDKKHLLIYSGGGDSVVTVRKILIGDILKSMESV